MRAERALLGREARVDDALLDRARERRDRLRGREVEHDDARAARRRERVRARRVAARTARSPASRRCTARDHVGDALARRRVRGSASVTWYASGRIQRTASPPGSAASRSATARGDAARVVADLDCEEGAERRSRTSSLLHASESRQIERRAEQMAAHPVDRDLRGEAAIALAVEGEAQLAHLANPRRSRARRRPGRPASPRSRPSVPRCRSSRPRGRCRSARARLRPSRARSARRRRRARRARLRERRAAPPWRRSSTRRRRP